MSDTLQSNYSQNTISLAEKQRKYQQQQTDTRLFRISEHQQEESQEKLQEYEAEPQQINSDSISQPFSYTPNPDAAPSWSMPKVNRSNDDNRIKIAAAQQLSAPQALMSKSINTLDFDKFNVDLEMNKPDVSPVSNRHQRVLSNIEEQIDRKGSLNVTDIDIIESIENSQRVSQTLPQNVISEPKSQQLFLVPTPKFQTQQGLFDNKKQFQMEQQPQNDMQQRDSRDKQAQSLFSSAFRQLKISNQSNTSSQQNLKIESPFELSQPLPEQIHQISISNDFITEKQKFKVPNSNPFVVTKLQLSEPGLRQTVIEEKTESVTATVEDQISVDFDKAGAEEIKMDFTTNHQLFEFKQPQLDIFEPKMKKQEALLPFKSEDINVSLQVKKVNNMGLSTLGLSSSQFGDLHNVNIKEQSHSLYESQIKQDSFRQPQDINMCQICMMKLIPAQDETLPCGHAFHLVCIQDHLVRQKKINQQPSCQQCGLHFLPKESHLQKIYQKMRKPIIYEAAPRIDHHIQVQNFENFGSNPNSGRSFGQPINYTAPSINSNYSQNNSFLPVSRSADVALPSYVTQVKIPANIPAPPVSDNVSQSSHLAIQLEAEKRMVSELRQQIRHEFKKAEQVKAQSETNTQLKVEQANNDQLRDEMDAQRSIIEQLQETVQKLQDVQDEPPSTLRLSSRSNPTVQSRPQSLRSSPNLRDADCNSERSHVSQQDKIIRKYSSYNQELQKQITEQNAMIDDLVKKVKQTQDDSNQSVKNLIQTGCVAILGYAVFNEALNSGLLKLNFSK